MARCTGCSAPLPPRETVCAYCGTRNQVDLHLLHEHTAEAPESERRCPHCEQKLRTFNVELGGKFLVEQCPDCFGLFFDPGELEALLERSASNVFEIDYSRLQSLAKTSPSQPVRYGRCPVCGTLMNRVNFGSRSGVVADVCKGHGLWLDGGELRQLLEWRKAGGQLLHEQVRAERAKEEAQRREKEARARGEGPGSAPSAAWEGSESGGPGLPDLLADLLRRLLR